MTSAPSLPNVSSPGTWLADLCAREGLPLVLGPALSMKAIHGGKAKHDKIEAPKMAMLLRDGMRPHADVSPAEMRAARALRRRRMQLPRQRAALLAHTHTTNRPYNLPEIGTKPADKSNRGGVAEWFSDPAVQKRIEVALTRITADDRLLTAVDCSIVTTAQQHDATPFDRRRSVPGIGTTLNLLLLYEMHASRRFPRAQEVVSSCRLVTWVKESAGQRSETSGATSGHASLTWACSEAAVLVLRDHPAGQTYLTRLETHHGQGKALTILAPTLARAVSDLFKRATTFALCRLVAT